MDEQEQYELTADALDQVVRGVIRKIRNAGDMSSPEGRMVFGIFEQAVRDAMWEPLVSDLELARGGSLAAKRRIREGQEQRGEARKWFGSATCGYYLELVGIDHGYALDKVGRLMRLTEAA